MHVMGKAVRLFTLVSLVAAAVGNRCLAEDGKASGLVPRDHAEEVRLRKRVTASLDRNTTIPDRPTGGDRVDEGDAAVIQFGDLISDDLASFLETDVYEFTTEFPGQVVFLDRTASASPNDLTWQLEDVWGRIMAQNTSALNDLGPVALIGGTYRITVRSDVATPVDYEFQLVDASPQAAAFVIGDVVSSDLDAPGQSDVYSFSAAAGQRVIFDAISSSNTGSTNWLLEDFHGRFVFTRTTSWLDQGPMTLMGGDYTLTVIGENDANATYSFQVIDVVDVSAMIMIGDTIIGDLSSPGQVDRYDFSASAGQVIYLDQLATSNSSGLNWLLTDAQGRAVLARTTSLLDNGPIPLAGGDYTLAIIGEGGNTGTYTFDLVDVIDDSSNVMIGDTIIGDLSSPGQVDRYDFSASAGQVIYLDQLTTSNSSRLNWLLSDAQGRAVLARTTSLLDNGPIPLAGGDYTLAIIGEGDDTGTYTFDLVDVIDDSSNVMIGDTIVGDVSGPGQIDRYEFTASAGQVIYLDQLTSSNSGGLNWILTDAFGRDVFPRTFSLADLGPISLVGGDYTLAIIGEGDDTGTYTFDLVDVIDDSSNVMIGDTIVGDVSGPGQIDRYDFTASAGQVIYLDQLTSSNSGGLNWVLTDAFGRDVFPRTFSLADQGPISLVGGDYTLAIIGEGDDTGTYTFDLVDVTDESAMIIIGDVVMGEVTVGQKDQYTFAAAANQMILLDQQATSNSGGLNWILTDTYGRDVLARTFSLVDQGPISLVGGTYTVTIVGEGAATGTYTFQIADQGTSSFTPTGTAINVGDEIMDVIATPGGDASYTFSVTAGQRVFVDLRANTSSMQWELFDPAGQSVFLKTATNSNSADAGPFTLAAGTYQLTLRATSGTATPSYHFKLWDVVDTTTPAALDMVIAGDFTDKAGATHAFTFAVTDGQTVYFDRITQTSQLRWRLDDPVGRLIFDIDADFLFNSDFGPITLGAGTYTLTLDPDFSAEPAYDFAIRNVSAETTTPIALDSVQAGDFIGDIGATRAFTFAVTDGQTVYFDRITQTSGLRWRLDDPVGRLIFDIDADFLFNSDFGPITLAAGTYTLTLDPDISAEPAYDFAVRSVSAETTTPITLDSVQAGDFIGAIGATRAFTFAVTDGQTVYFDRLTTTSQLRWRLADPVGRLIFDIDADFNSSGDFGPITLVAGTYTLTLDPDISAEPAYDFAIRSVAETTTPITLDSVQAGDFIGAIGATRAFTFAVTDGQSVYFDVITSTSQLRWRLADPVGRLIFDVAANSNISGDVGPITLAAGTYTLILDPDFSAAPAYDFVVRSVSAETTTPITLDSVQAGDFIGDIGATRAFTFAVTDGQTVYFDVITSTNQLRWRLNDPVGQLVFDIDADSNLSGDVGPITMAAGTYTLILDPDFSAEPAYDFNIVSVADTSIALIFDTPIMGSIGHPGATAGYTFTANDGRRILFDIASGTSQLDWSLIDQVGERVFNLQDAVNTDDDQGPFNLTAAQYTIKFDATFSNTAAFEFTAVDIAADLAVTDLDADPRVIFESLSPRDVAVTWTVENLGGGAMISSDWTDRLVFSVDDILGNEDDEIIGDFTNAAGLPGHAVYSRTETVTMSDLLTGSFFVFVIIDVNDDITEALGETNNTSVLQLAVVPDPDLDLDTITRVDTFPVSFTTSPTEVSVDIPLVGQILLDDVRFVLVDSLRIGIASSSGGSETIARVILLNGTTELLEVSSFNPSTTGSGATFVGRFSRKITGELVAGLPASIADGVRIRFDQPASTQTTITSIHADQTLHVHFAGCEFHSCGPHVERIFEDLPAIVFDGEGTSDWQINIFAEPVIGDDLRLVSGPNFSANTSGFFIGPNATSEAQLILDDGMFVTLDDWQGPSTLENPQVGISASHSLALDGDQLDGRLVTGFQWRVHVSGGLSPSATYTPANPLVLSFLYGQDECIGAIPVAPIEIDPPKNSEFAAGTQVTITGRALIADTTRPVSIVLINGEPPDAVDVAGRFFKAVTVDEGDNLFLISVVEPLCGETEVLLRLEGITPEDAEFDQYSEVTAQLDDEYVNTTFNHATDTLIVEVRPRNIGDTPIDGPLLMAIGSQLDPSITPLNSAGFTPDGLPFYTMLDQGDSLAPGDAGPSIRLLFKNPDHLPVDYEVVWFAQGNRAPYFTSVPPTTAIAASTYTYSATATDPDEHFLMFLLTTGPNGMSIDSLSGDLLWLPAPADLGVHDVIIAVEDGRGGSAEQHYTLSVVDFTSNRVPVFTTGPVTHASIGAPYAYDADAVDPDGNTLTFALTAGPMDMTIVPDTGLVEWDFAEPGSYGVTVEVTDGIGGPAVQTYVLTVGDVPSNPSAPLITTSPQPTALVDVLYIYQPVVTDPDGDDLTFSLDLAPTGPLFDTDTGRFEWTPDLTQVGVNPVTFSVVDGRGGFAEQSFDINVLADPVNLPPMFETFPGQFAVVDEPFVYDAFASDPEAQQVTYSTPVGPIELLVDPMTGSVTWTPIAGDEGLHTVALEAADPLGAAGSQVFQIDVRSDNTDPQFATDPPLNLIGGQTYQYDAHATDADGDLVQFTLTAAPAGMTADRITGQVTWPTTNADVGLHPVVLTATDCCGGLDTQMFDVTVDPDNEAPEIDVVFSESPAPINEPIEVFVLASDNIGLTSVTLTVECDPGIVTLLPLDDFRSTSFLRDAPGLCTFVGTATDRSGTVSVDNAPLVVGDPQAVDPFPPVVRIISPAPEGVITGPTDIVADITDGTTGGEPGSDLSWTVQIARVGTDVFTVIGSGSGEVAGGVIAMFDPTLLPNDNYVVQVIGNDGLQTGGIEFQYGVAGEYKLGNFAVSFTDLTIPVAGIPLVVTRQYDSLDTTSGDFGAGWNLGLAGRVSDSVEESTTGDDLIALLGSQPYTNNTRVYVTRPDGRRVGFTFDPMPLPFPQVFQFLPRFKPDPGVTDTLAAVSLTGSTTVWNFGTGFLEFVIPYNPRIFKFKTKEGVTYTIDEFDGLQFIEDANGNTIDVTPNGLFSSTGVSLVFERDGAGRIIKITEPDDPGDPDPPGELDYVYDVNGNLVIFRDQMDHETEYFYEDPNFPNYLTRIEDPLDRPVVRNVFDDDGRIIGRCDANGDPTTLEGCITFDLDPGSTVQTIVNARGYQTDIILDERGNVRFERRFLDIPPDPGNFLETERVYDLNNNELEVIDPLGNSWTRTYDERGNMLSRTDPSGTRTWTWTYNECNKVVTKCDPMSNCTVNTYGLNCNLRFVEDALGGVTEFRFNDAGQPTDFIDAEGNHWQFHRDPTQGLPTGFTDPLGHQAAIHFNVSGELEWVIDRNGRRIDLAHDDNHRLVTETWDTDPPRVATYGYDDAGNQTSAVDPDSALTLDYWNTGHVKSIDNSGTLGAPHVVITYGFFDGPLLKTGYDGNGNVTHVMDSLDGMTEYEYDALDRLTSIKQYGVALPALLSGVLDVSEFIDSRVGVGNSGVENSAKNDLRHRGRDGEADQVIDHLLSVRRLRLVVRNRSISEKRVDLVYDDASALRELRRFSDLAGTLGVANTFLDYDCGGCPLRLTEIHHRKASDNGIIHDLDFVRDALGNILQMSDAEGSHVYSHDGMRRMLSADHPDGGDQPDESYTYDAAGNRLSSHLSSSYVYSYMLPACAGLGECGNQLHQDDQFDYEYDNKGSIILKTDRTTGDSTEYTYDHRNRLIVILQLDSDGAELSRFSYVYDAANRRIRAEEDGDFKHFAYDGQNPILKLDGAGGEISRRMYSRLIDGILADQTVGETRWFLADQVGTVRDLISDSASVLTHYTYDSFGALLSQTDPFLENDLLFNAREFTHPTTLGYYRARFYDPAVGRFLQEDSQHPLGYEFVNNNPNVFADPMGTGITEFTLLLNAISVRILLGLAIWTCAGGNPGACVAIVPAVFAYIVNILNMIKTFGG